MSDFAPITLRVIDNTGTSLFQYSVPFEPQITAREVLEYAFVIAQTSPTPDPFAFTLKFYGYSESAQFPGYLGYEIESINNLENNAQCYWDLLVDGTTSSSGADTTYPHPGATILWQYTPIPAPQAALSRRAALVRSSHSAPA